jgi:uncharacterized phage protein (TIGR02220 family)
MTIKELRKKLQEALALLDQLENPEIKDCSSQIIDFLNEQIGSNYRKESKTTIKFIKARLAEGYKLEDFKRVILNKKRSWLNSQMQAYLRPQTLFGSNFEAYLNESDPELELAEKLNDLLAQGKEEYKNAQEL